MKGINKQDVFVKTNTLAATKSLTFVSFERALLVEYACKI